MTVRVRAIEPGEDVPPALGASAQATVLVAETDDGAPLAGAADPAGMLTEPEATALRLEPVGGHPVKVVETLLRQLIDRARASGSERIVLAWDTMDTEGQRILADLGFRPTGTQPYFDRGTDVEHVSGYTDPTGSVTDFVLA